MARTHVHLRFVCLAMILRLPYELRRLVASYADGMSLVALCNVSWTCWRDAGPVLWHEVNGLRNLFALLDSEHDEVHEKSGSRVIDRMAGVFPCLYAGFLH
jgi:hypothetical protein